MKLHCCTWHDASLGRLQFWGRTQRAAIAKAEEQVGADFPDRYEVISQELPLNPDAVVRWLNANFTTDNG